MFRLVALLSSLALFVAGAALDALGGRAVDVVGRNPACIVTLVSTSSDALTRGGGLLVDDPGLLALGSSGLLGSREECRNVGVVDEVGDTGKSSTEDEVQEDAGIVH